MIFSKKSFASRLLCFFSIIGMMIMLIPFSSFSVKAIGDTSLFGEILVSDTGTSPSIDRRRDLSRIFRQRGL